MADPVKPLDRTKPFKRINNEAFRPQTKPDGDGVRCGCRTFAQFGDPGKEFDEFIKDNVPIAGPILRAVDLIRKLLDPVELAKLLFEALRKELPDALAVAFTA